MRHAKQENQCRQLLESGLRVESGVRFETAVLLGMHRMLLEAEAHYDIWWSLRAPQTHDIFAAALDSHKSFFVWTSRAHFITVITTLFALNEKGPAKFSLRNLAQSAQSESSFPQNPLHKQLPEQMKRLNFLWEKVSILRNNVYAHRQPQELTEKWFKQAKVSPQDIEDYLVAARKVLDLSSRIVSHRSFRRRRSRSTASLSLLEKLNDGAQVSHAK